MKYIPNCDCWKKELTPSYGRKNRHYFRHEVRENLAICVWWNSYYEVCPNCDKKATAEKEELVCFECGELVDSNNKSCIESLLPRQTECVDVEFAKSIVAEYDNYKNVDDYEKQVERVMYFVNRHIRPYQYEEVYKKGLKIVSCTNCDQLQSELDKTRHNYQEARDKLGMCHSECNKLRKLIGE